MNEPKIVNVTWHSSPARYTVDVPSWDGGQMVSLEEIATYIEKDSQIFLPLVPGETKRAYGLRMLKELAAEIRRIPARVAARTEYAGPGSVPVTPDPAPSCWCHTCRPVTMADMRFVACPDCGNKRCPRANDHQNSCTNSNETGQPGSAYPA